MNTVTGTAGNDSLLGTEGTDSLSGLAGHDTLAGLGGNDSLAGGYDTDWLYGGLGDDTLDGGKGNDYVNYATSSAAITANLITGLATGEGSDTLIGIENIQGSRFNDHLTGDAQANWLWSQDGRDTLVGGAGNDTLDSGWGTEADSLQGGDGDDLLITQGPDTLDGGAGLDKVRFSAIEGGVDVDLSNLTYRERRAPDNPYALNWVSIEQVEGSSGDDVIRGDANNNQLFGGKGHDTLYGGAGDDELSGHNGLNFWTAERNTMDGGEGTDTVIYEVSRQQIFVTVHDTPGSYWISLGASYDLVHGVEKIRLSDGLFDLAALARAQGDFTGSDAHESISGSPGHDTIRGQGGDDHLYGLDGHDSLSGGDGSDRLLGGPDDDTLDGGAGNDWATYENINRAITANLGTGVATGDGSDTLVSIENIDGSQSHDLLTGNAQPNGLRGNGGSDTLVGDGGNDTLDGGWGADSLQGGDGDDHLLVRGPDTLDGGAGLDKVLFDGAFGGVDVDLSNNTYWERRAPDNPFALNWVSIEQVQGSSDDDVIRGDANPNTLMGGYGSDTLYGGAGDDLLYGSQDGSWNATGGDVLHGGEGADTVVYPGQRSQFRVQLNDSPNSYLVLFESVTDTLQEVENITFNDGTFALSALATAKGLIQGTDQPDVLYGTNGNDTVEGLAGDDQLSGRLGNDRLDGGAGNDGVNFGSSDTAITANLITGAATGEGSDTLVGIENIQGSRFNDHLTGDAQANGLWGQDGRDTLLGGAGNDTLDGGWGAEADSLQGGDGDDLLLAQGPDTLDGGTGLDKVQFRTGGSGVDFNWATGVYFERQTPGAVHTLTLSGMEQIEGTSYADVLTGDAGDNQLWGGPGDTLYGGAGDDLLHSGFFYTSKSGTPSPAMSVYGGEGSDTFVYGGMRNQVRVHLGQAAGSYEVFAPTGAMDAFLQRKYEPVATLDGVEKVQFTDGMFNLAEIATVKGFIKGSDQSDFLWGSSDNETLEGWGGNDQLQGEGGQDLLLGGDGDDSLSGGPGHDTLIGGSGNDTLRGDFGDSLTGSDGLDSVMGGDGDDLIHAGIDNDTLDGGHGKDKLSFVHVGSNGSNASLSGVDINLATGVSFPRSSPESKRTLNLLNIEQIEGSPYADVITGDAHDNELFGGMGIDTLYGADGNDTLQGDVVYSSFGFEGFWLNPSSDVLNGGNDIDTAMYSGSRVRYFVNRAEGANNYTIAAGSNVDLAYGVEKIKFNDGTFDLNAIASAQGVYKGTELSDTITGGSGQDTMEGFDGDDVLKGQDGHDSLVGGAGQDDLWGGLGDDVMDGGAGQDTAHYTSSSVGITADLQAGWVTGAGADSLVNVENLTGSTWDDRITGNTLANVLMGQSGNDTLVGGGANDTLDGSAGADLLQGGEGDDVLSASLDLDTLDGGVGQDRIRFDGVSGGVEFDLSTSTVKLPQQAASYALRLIGIEQIEGSAAADLITGDGNSNELFGGGGSDTLYGGAGHDTLHGGSQIAVFGSKGTNDILYGGTGIDTVVYSGSRSEVTVQMLGAPGTYQITYGTSLDTVYEAEKITFSDGTFELSAVADPQGLFRGTPGHNNLTGTSGHDSILGLAGDDSLNGLDGHDSLSGGDGDDRLWGGLGDDTIDGGAGNDWANYNNFYLGNTTINAIDANLITGLATGEGSDTLIGIENIEGSESHDVLTGNAQPNWLRGNGGRDTLMGGAGNDTLDGGWDTEADSLQAGEGDDLLLARGPDTLDGGVGLDKVQFNTGGSGVDFNWATGVYFERPIPGIFSQPSGVLHPLTLSGIEQIEGSAYADVLTGDAGDNQLLGGAGNDTLDGGVGNDTLTGGQGDNQLHGGLGVDVADFSGNRSQYLITRQADKSVTVQSISTLGPTEVSTLIGIEQLKFADVVHSLDQPFITGRAYHWKTLAVLSDATVDLLGPVATATASQQIQFKSPLLDTAKGKLTVEVWAESRNVVDSFTFTLKNAAAMAAVFNSEALGPDWVVNDNASESPKNFTVGGMVASGLSTNASGHFKLGTVSFDIPANTALPTTVLDSAFLDTSRVANAVLSFASDPSDMNGLYFIAPAQNGLYEMKVSRAAVDSGSAITAADALAALRIAVGLNPNPDPDGSGPLKAGMISPYQIMAADVNKNGQVSSADALAILRMAVKLSTAPAQEWLFVDEKRDFWNESNQEFTLSRSLSTWSSSMQASSEIWDNHNLVGVLKGDVNGSWSAPAGTPSMTSGHATYISDVARLMGVPIDQWGVASSSGQTFTLT